MKYIYCEPCGYKKISEDVDEIKRPDIQGHIPQLNQPKSKTVSIPSMVKCPQCGRSVVVKSLPEVYKKTIEKHDKNQKNQQSIKDFEQRIKDGIPLKREKQDEDHVS